MTTTRETADHAELLAKLANDMRKFEHHAVGSLRIGMDEVRKVIAACDSHAALLSEIAALREKELLWIEVAQKAQEDRILADQRATQADRQRDELRKALKRIAHTPDGEDGLSLTECVNIARQALANQGADKL